MDGTTAPPKRFSDDFYLYTFKIAPCKAEYPHNWSICPFAHPNEHARRRDPRLYKYDPIPCPHDRKGYNCPEGDKCPGTHNVYEYHLHPKRFRTQMCQQGAACTRPLCFFAHDMKELRVTSESSDNTATAGDCEPPAASSPSAAAPGVRPASEQSGGSQAAAAAALPAVPSAAQLSTQQTRQQHRRQPQPQQPPKPPPAVQQQRVPQQQAVQQQAVQQQAPQQQAPQQQMAQQQMVQQQAPQQQMAQQQVVQQQAPQQQQQAPQPYVSPVASCSGSMLQPWAQTVENSAVQGVPPRQQVVQDSQQPLQQQQAQGSNFGVPRTSGCGVAAADALTSSALPVGYQAIVQPQQTQQQLAAQPQQQVGMQQLQQQLEQLLVQSNPLAMAPAAGVGLPPNTLQQQAAVQFVALQRQQQQLLQQLGMLQLQAEQQQYAMMQSQLPQQLLLPQQCYGQPQPQEQQLAGSYLPMFETFAKEQQPQQQQQQFQPGQLWPSVLNPLLVQQQYQALAAQTVAGTAGLIMPAAVSDMQLPGTAGPGAPPLLPQQVWNAQAMQPLQHSPEQQQLLQQQHGSLGLLPVPAMLQGSSNGSSSASTSSNAVVQQQLAASQDSAGIPQARNLLSPHANSSSSNQFGLWGNRAWGP